MSQLFHVYLGIDPGSEFLGVAWLDGFGNPLTSTEKNPSFVTLKAPSRQGRQARLDILHDALTTYATYFFIGYESWLNRNHERDGTPFLSLELTAIGIEEPSDRFKGDSHTTPFVNGMSFRTAYLAAQELLGFIHSTAPIYELKPGKSSEAFGLRPGAAKYERLGQACQLGQGRYRWRGYPETDVPGVSSGWCEGGMLDGATADALDALSVANAARAHHISQSRISQAEQQHGTKRTRTPRRGKPGSSGSDS